MPIIEGIGDEVLYTFIVVLISIVVVLVWMSTYVNPRDYNYLVYVDHYMFDIGRRLYRVVGGELTASNLAHLETPRTNDDRVVSSSLQPSVFLGTPDMSSSSSSDVIPSYTTSSSTSSASNLPVCDTSSSDLPSDTSSSLFCPVLVNQQRPKNTPSTSLHPEPTETSTTLTTFATATTSTAATTATAATTSATATTAEHLKTDNQPSTSKQIDNVEGSRNDSPHNNGENVATSNNANDATADDNIPDGHITIKLQFIDGTQRIVHANPDETIGEFKRRNFSAELESRSTVRFIMSGQELKNESMSLRSYKVSDNIIIHCLVLTSQQAPPSSSTTTATRQQRRGGLNDIGSLAFPVFGMGLGALWYARIFYRGYFNGASTVSLLAITFLYGLSLIASFRTPSPPNNQNHLHRD